MLTPEEEVKETISAYRQEMEKLQLDKQFIEIKLRRASLHADEMEQDAQRIKILVDDAYNKVISATSNSPSNEITLHGYMNLTERYEHVLSIRDIEKQLERDLTETRDSLTRRIRELNDTICSMERSLLSY
jgi:glycyl-tRNA synthetase alpha subunit